MRRDDTFMPRQGFHFCSSVESVCVQHSHQLSADMCLHEQLVTLMQRDSTSYGSSVQQLLPYVPKKKPLDNSLDSSSVKLHHRQSQHCTSVERTSPLFILTPTWCSAACAENTTFITPLPQLHEIMHIKKLHQSSPYLPYRNHKLKTAGKSIYIAWLVNYLDFETFWLTTYS